MPISSWVKGVPRSLAAQKKEAYTALIQEAARSVFNKPVQSPRIDVEIISPLKIETFEPMSTTSRNLSCPPRQHNVLAMASPKSLISQRDHRIYSSGTPRGDIARRERYEH
jgi:hypothetical protein